MKADHTEETKPGRAAADSGVVILDGPNGVAVTMSADAAIATADSLRDAAEVAKTQAHG